MFLRVILRGLINTGPGPLRASYKFLTGRNQLLCECVFLNMKGEKHNNVLYQNILVNTVGYVLSLRYLDRHNPRMLFFMLNLVKIFWIIYFFILLLLFLIRLHVLIYLSFHIYMLQRVFFLMEYFTIIRSFLSSNPHS